MGRAIGWREGGVLRPAIELQYQSAERRVFIRSHRVEEA